MLMVSCLKYFAASDQEHESVFFIAKFGSYPYPAMHLTILSLFQGWSMGLRLAADTAVELTTLTKMFTVATARQ